MGLIRARKRKTIDPCGTCRLHHDRCICSEIPFLDLKTRISLVIHAKELKRTTNTGQLALKALPNSKMYIRGLEHQKLDLSHLITPQYESYVLYPTEDAVDIETIKPSKPVHLIVADGNWRQAGKFNQRHPELSNLPRVKIGKKNPNQYFLRQEHFDTGFSTLEAIAFALGALEGEKVQYQLLELYHAKLTATLVGRGMLGSRRDLPTLHN